MLPLLNRITSFGEGAAPIEEKLQLLQAIRASGPEITADLDRYMIEQNGKLSSGLMEARAQQEKLKEILEKLGATPWHPAVFLKPVTTILGERALVSHGSTCRLVGLTDEAPLGELQAGDEVFLSDALNVIMSKSPFGTSRSGETAIFDRYTSDGRLVLKWRDDEVIVEAAGPLQHVTLENGDELRWEKSSWLAYEKIERTQGKRFLLDEVPDISTDKVGGQEANLEALLAALTITLVAPDKAKNYGLGGRQSILMVGPPGCGKTLMARVSASHVSRLSGKRCRFGVVKPAEWEDPYVGVTQQNIRNTFQTLREAAKDGFAVLFLDEIEAVGRIRGGSVSHHSDKFLAALLAELDGFTDRAGVAIIAATNRKDLIDPALLERLSDLEIVVNRPDQRGARAIFGIHLPETLPFSPNGPAATQTRRDLIETAVSRFYSPNGDTELCTIKFRDGKVRKVSAREVASGRTFEQICRAARQKAFLREVRGGEAGLRVEDIDEAACQAVERLRSTLSPRNIRSYLFDLPQDIDVVSVEPIARRVPRPGRYVAAGL
jgi:proteasome-associated ATPase